MLQVLLLQLILKSAMSSNASCPNMCSCNHNEIQCEGLQLTDFSFPVELCPKSFIIRNSNFTEIKTSEHQNCSTQLKYLHIINSGKFEIFPETFIKFKDLHWLNLRENVIVSLKSGVFKGLKHLEVLDLESNGIESIKFGTFNSLEHLTTLSLSYNMLSFLEVGVFQSLVHLKQLKLANNLLEKVKPEYFIGLSNLNKLYLSGNKIHILQTNAFVHSFNNSYNEVRYKNPLQRLQFLYLQNNCIENIEPNAFEGLKHIVFLNLNGNKLHKLHLNSFRGLVKLNHLQLENCSLKELYPGAFKGLDELHELYMGKNNFFTLSPKYFEGLLQLKLLRVSEYIYYIQHSMFNSTPNLINLNLDNNLLEELPLNVTKDLTKLEVLSLSKNKIQVLEKYMFKCLSKLRVLILDDNGIHIIHDDAFCGLNRLQKLSLRNNNICSLSNDTPIAYYSPKSFRKPFMKMEELTHLDLHGNCLENLGVSSFNYLPKLFSLNLGSNKLSEVEVSVIVNIVTLKELVLEGNPLNCNCNLMEIRKWILKNNINISVELRQEPTCATGIQWDIAFRSLSCIGDDKATRFLKKFGLFMIGPAAIVVIGLLSWGYTQMKRKPDPSKP